MGDVPGKHRVRSRNIAGRNARHRGLQPFAAGQELGVFLLRRQVESLRLRVTAEVEVDVALRIQRIGLVGLQALVSPERVQRGIDIAQIGLGVTEGIQHRDIIRRDREDLPQGYDRLPIAPALQGDLGQTALGGEVGRVEFGECGEGARAGGCVLPEVGRGQRQPRPLVFRDGGAARLRQFQHVFGGGAILVRHFGLEPVQVRESEVGIVGHGLLEMPCGHFRIRGIQRIRPGVYRILVLCGERPRLPAVELPGYGIGGAKQTAGERHGRDRAPDCMERIHVLHAGRHAQVPAHSGEVAGDDAIRAAGQRRIAFGGDAGRRGRARAGAGHKPQVGDRQDPRGGGSRHLRGDDAGEGAAHPVERRVGGEVLAAQDGDARGGWRRLILARAAHPCYEQQEHARATTRLGNVPSVPRFLENTRLQGHQFLEFRQLAEGVELRIFHQFLFVAETFFERFADVLQRAIVHARLGVRLGQVVVELGAFLHAALLQQDAVGAVVLEDVRVERERRLVCFRRLLVISCGRSTRCPGCCRWKPSSGASLSAFR